MENEVQTMINDSCTTSVTYSNHIEMIIGKTCAISGCHVASGFKDFSNYSALKLQLDQRGAAFFISRIEAGGGMPPSYTQGPAALSACEKIRIKTWINSGYPNN